MIPDYKIRIREPDYTQTPIACTLIFDTEDITNLNREEVISIKASRTVSGETPEAEVVFDNDPRKAFKEGDILEIELGWLTLGTRLVFSGVIYEAQENSTDEEKTITVRAKDWSFLLLTDKVTLSYPSSENIATIVRAIIDTKVVAGPVGYCDLAITGTIGIGHIEDDSSKRQLDFVGEAMIDALNKVDDICEHDWYINADKDFQYFPRFSRPAVAKILEATDLEDYTVSDPYDNLCNKVDFYGNSHKKFPYDGDLLTENIVQVPDPGQPDGLDINGDGIPEWRNANVGGSNLVVGVATPKAGSKYMKWGTGGVGADAWIYLNFIELNISSPVDFTSKQAFKTLHFWFRAQGGDPAIGVPRIDIELWCANNPANCFTWTLNGEYIPSGSWWEFNIPIGEDYEEPGKWVKSGGADWSQVTQVAINQSWGNPGLYEFWIDNFYFGEGKYFGTYEDPPKTELWCHLNEVAGASIADSSGYGRTGTTYNAPTWVAGKLNNALVFDGINQYADFGKTVLGFEIHNPWSVEFWFKSSQNAASVTILGKQSLAGAGWHIGFDNAQFVGELKDSALNMLKVRTNDVFNDGNWHHVVICYDGRAYGTLDGSLPTKGFFIYVDNVLKAVTIVNNALTDSILNNDKFQIASKSDGAGEYFAGTLDEIKIYNGVLSTDLITQRYNAGIGTESAAKGSQDKYGIKYRELFDDTVFSDRAAQRRSEKMVTKFKEPLGLVDNVIIEFTADSLGPAPWNVQGQEYLEPGDKIVFSTPSTNTIVEFDGLTLAQRTYRIETITHIVSEEFEYTCELVVSLDPVLFEGKVATISERARRLEQKYYRKEAQEPLERG